MKRGVLAVGILLLVGAAFWFVTRPTGSVCDCAVQSYSDAYKDYCHELGMQQPYGNRLDCSHDYKTAYDEENGYTKYDAIAGYDQDGLPVWVPVVLKDDGKYPTNKHVEQIKQALETLEPTEINP